VHLPFLAFISQITDCKSKMHPLAWLNANAPRAILCDSFRGAQRARFARPVSQRLHPRIHAAGVVFRRTLQSEVAGRIFLSAHSEK
jgi:hypothetical protein